MNAHLVHVWMAFHPPFLFVSYALFLAPLGAALQALVQGRGPWKEIADWTVRLGWWTLSTGLALGMWWAYQDFTFGQIWHWDPVQTSVFAVWALATGHAHCLRRYRLGGAFAIVHPALGLATVGAAFLSLSVTRSPILASSHRYIGDTSLPLLLAGAAIATALGLAAFLWALMRRQTRTHRVRGEQGWLLRIGVYGFVACAAIALLQIGYAYLSAVQGLARPADLRPFFEMLTRWAPTAEMQGLRRAFAQWDVDSRAVNVWLTPLGILAGLLIGHNFLPLKPGLRRWAITLTAAAAIFAVAWLLKPFDRLFSGGGMISGATVANFRGLEALTLALAYAAASMIGWTARQMTKSTSPGSLFGYTLPVGLIHLGISIALVAATVATVFDTYAQKIVPFPPAVGKPIQFPGGYAVTVQVGPQGLPDDGGRGGFRSVGRVSWSLTDEGRVVEQAVGHTVYRDDRESAGGGRGSMRLICEILDYRYARHVSDTRHMIHPFIHRGLLRDVQLWFPVMPLEPGGASTVPVVLKVYPFLSWVWVGLALTLFAALSILVHQASLWHARRRAVVARGRSDAPDRPAEPDIHNAHPLP